MIQVAKIKFDACYQKPEKILKWLGYKPHTRGYVKSHKDGRFHAIIFGGDIELHFDVTTPSGHHMVLPSDYTTPRELSRFLTFMKKFPRTLKEEKKKEFKPPSLKSIQTGISDNELDKIKKDKKTEKYDLKKQNEIRETIQKLGYVPNFLKGKIKKYKIDFSTINKQ